MSLTLARRAAALIVALAGLAVASTVAHAQAAKAAPEPPPAIRRWVDVQQLQLTGRFRFVQTRDGRTTSSTIQYQPQLKTRFNADPDGHVSLQLGLFGGSQFISGWNNAGPGIGDASRQLSVKQLFLALAPTKAVEFQVGSLYLTRGENTEVTTWDNDGFIEGERLTVRVPHGPVNAVGVTTAYLGDLNTPSAFDRLQRFDQWNYRQVLLTGTAGKPITWSADYSHYQGQDVLHQGATVRLPKSAGMFTAVRIEGYERLAPTRSRGYDLGLDLRPLKKLTASVGVVTIDRNYGVLNADRYLRGTRFFSQGMYALTPEIGVGWWQGEAFHNDFVVPNQHRFEILLQYNPLAQLKRKRVL